MASVLASLFGPQPASSADQQPATTPTVIGERPVASAGPLEYRPGRGLRVGSTGLVVGGFTNVKGEQTEDSGGEFAIDRLNFFLIYDRFTRFRAVAELQLKDIFAADEERAGTHDFAFDARRLFADFTATDALRLRAGTFLTSVGYWNLLLAPPLTWTTEAPLIVEEAFFQPTTTGTMLHGSTRAARGQIGYALFSQFLQPLEDDPDLDPPDYTAGARLTYDTGPGWSVGASYQFADDDGEATHMGATHLFWQHQRGEILAEAYVQDGTGLPALQWGGYVQSVVQLHGPLYAVGRYEHFKQPAPAPTLNLFTLGAVLKPFPFMAFKVEYRFADDDPEGEDLRGFFASVSTFF